MVNGEVVKQSFTNMEILDVLDRSDFSKCHMTPIKAIRLNCIYCSITWKEVARCEITNCPLYPYRMGRRPGKGSKPLRNIGELSKEQGESRYQDYNGGLHEKYAKL